ncbi:MAG TPA: ABC transporter substrate-binding protein [Candidatus Peribacterales bacterium]|nr:ABC transporter substrate-binding protein [Candidatus Peribacterales bacterium]
MAKRFLSLLSLGLLTLTACQTGGSGDEGPLKVGFIGPLTGDAAPYGVDMLNGTKMAVEEINTAGGVNGRMIELVVEDGRCTGADSASAAQKLVNVDKVIAIIGGGCSGETLAAAPIAEAASVVMISPLSSSPDVTMAGDFIFRDYPSDALKTKAMASLLREEEFTKLAMISENTDFAQAFRESLKQDLGVDMVVFDEVVDPGTKDFRTLITRLKDLEFDIFFPNGQSDAAIAAMMQQLREQGLLQQAISHDVADSITLGTLAPEAVEGMYIVNVPTAGEGGEFQKTFDQKFGGAQATIAFAAHSYDATKVLAKAIGTVGTAGTAIRDYLYSMPAFSGVVGNFTFDRNGDVVGIPYGLKAFKEGAIVKVRDLPVLP